MSIVKKEFGRTAAGEVYAYTLDNGNGFSVEILNFGGILRRIVWKGTDVILGRDSIEEYQKNDGYFGALIGRNSNRIADSKFTLNGKTYTLAKNDGENNLHGGNVGFDQKIWDVAEKDGDEPSLVLSLVSPDMEEGFPGTAKITVTYTVTRENSIRIHYEGECDQTTVLNMTNHSYFNLNGHNAGNIENHTLQMEASFYTPNSPACVPNGEVLSVTGTPFDFRTPKKVGADFGGDDAQIALFGGYDHNFPLDGFGFRKVVTLTGDQSGITMEMYTDQPATQLYTGNAIEEGRVCKEGAVYTKHSGLCLESQVFPNNLSFSHFPTSVLKKGEKYDTTTEYKFR